MKIRNLAIVICLLVGLVVSPPTSASSYSPEASIPAKISFTQVVGGLTQPVFATHAGDGSGRMFIVQKTGQILILKGTHLNTTPFLNISTLITTGGGQEQGLLGLAFDPNYATNGYFYIVYTNKTGVGNDVLARYHVSGDPDVADNASAQILLTVSEPETNHNGGMIAFGPDGYLYFGLGDGGGGGDSHGSIGNGQDKTTLLGKILRLDVSTVPYTIPPTNPFYGSVYPSVKKEIWAYGVRNPWRFSFDKITGDLFIGDVGQDAQEEIDYQTSRSAGGENYGWRIREGNLCYNPSSNCISPSGYVAPVATYDHGPSDSIGCAVTGGYIYRGANFPWLTGVYLFGDFCSGKLWGLVRNASNLWTQTFITSNDYNISSFAEDEQGELYILDYYGGQLISIIPSSPPFPGISLNGSSLTISLNAGEKIGKNADWWFVAKTPWGHWFYYVYPNRWIDIGTDLSKASPAYQGPLSDISSLVLFDTTGIPSGNYVFYFGVDTNMNGILDYDQLFYSSLPL